MHRVAAFIAALVALVSLGTGAVQASEGECIQLAFVAHQSPRVQPDDARALFSDVNAFRAEHGLPVLSEDDHLSRFALQVAEQMAARHYFGHTDPAGITFEDRLKAAGMPYRVAAENMAFDQDEPHANAALLASPGHLANIVDPRPRRMGTAVVAAGDGEVFFVEEFAD
jgi:uncharacterized protein YkwD